MCAPAAPGLEDADRFGGERLPIGVQHGGIEVSLQRAPRQLLARKGQIGPPIDADHFTRNLRDRAHQVRCAQREEHARGTRVGEAFHDAYIVRQTEFAIGALVVQTGPTVEELNRVGARGNLHAQIRDRQVGEFLEQQVNDGRIAAQELPEARDILCFRRLR